MKLSAEQRLKVNVAVERMIHKLGQERKNHPEIELGDTEAPSPEGYVEDDPLRKRGSVEWANYIEPENSELDKVLLEILATAPKTDPAKMAKLTGENLWVWGGPTPFWGGSMADDTLVRGADYFSAENVVYVYGPTDDKMMSIHSKYKRMLCQINANCRTPGAQGNFTDEENAEYLSKLSLKYPNIIGAMCDDVTTNFHKIVLPESFEARYRGLKKYNDKLRMFGVVYAHELDKDFSLIQQYIDVVNLWLWHKDDLIEYDELLEKCRKAFPGKPIIQGIFLHEYGRSDIGNVIELLKYQLDRAREYMAQGVVEGVIILGDREIKKWPAVAEAIREYLQNQ